MKIDDHDYAGLNRDSKECDIANCDGDTEVIFEQILQQQSSAHRIDGWEDQDQSLRNRVKDQIEQQENHEEDNGKDQLQPLLCPQFELILSRPLTPVNGRQRQFVVQQPV